MAERTVDISSPILSRNERLAAELRERFARTHTFVVNVLSSPGSGKTSTILATDALLREYGLRSAVGLTFDPSSTADNLIAWVSHCSTGLTSAPEFDGNLSRPSCHPLFCVPSDRLDIQTIRFNRSDSQSSLVSSPARTSRDIARGAAMLASPGTRHGTNRPQVVPDLAHFAIEGIKVAVRVRRERQWLAGR